MSGPLYRCLGTVFSSGVMCRCHRRQVYGEIAIEPLWIGRGATHMLKDIQRVEKSGASRILLHKDKGKTEDLVRTITTLHLTVTDLALRSTASFDSKVRTHEGADLHGIIGATEYLRSDGSAPFFDVLSASTGAAATGTATCEDRLYAFQGESLRRIERIRLRVQSGTPARDALPTDPT